LLRSRTSDIFAAATYLTGWCRLWWLTHRHRLTVLVYHDPSPESFRTHIKHLSRWFNFISLDDFLSGQRLPPWPAVITLDDGYKNNYKLLPTIKEFKLKPVVYLNSALIGTDDSFWFEKIPYKLRETLKELPDELRLKAVAEGKEAGAEGSCLTMEQIGELSSAGVEFGSHSRTHPVLIQCDKEKIKDEISGSKTELEQKLGLPVKHFSYPNGDYNQQITGIVRESGYISARTIRNGCSRAQDDPFQLRAHNISDDAGYFKLICQSCGLFVLPSMIRTWGEKLRARPYRKEDSLNVLLTIDSLGVGGAERQLIELARGLADKPGINCQVLAMSRQDHYTALQDSGIIVHRLVRRVRHDWTVFLRMYGLLKKLRPDIVHSWDYMTAIYALPACKLLGIKFINGAIRYSSKRLDRLYKLKAAVTFPPSDAIVANSLAGLKVHGLEDKSKARVINNGIDLGRFSRGKAKSKKDLGITTKNAVGMVATFSDYKDYPTFVKAAQKILAVRDDVTFIAVGDGPGLDSVKQSVSDENKGKVIFTGQLKDVESVIPLFDVGVLATFDEGFPNVIMEYMACKVPSVASGGGGTGELINDGRNGFLVQQGNVEQMVERIVSLLDDGKLAAEMGARGYEMVCNLSHTAMTVKYLELYRHTSGKR